MKLFTRDVDYAMRALGYISISKTQRVSVSELVKKLKIPRPFLRKILQILEKKKLLYSYKGKGGGFRMALAPEKVFLLDLIKIFQKPFHLNECFFKKHLCPNTQSCLLKKKIDKIEQYVIKELAAITVADLLR